MRFPLIPAIAMMALTCGSSHAVASLSLDFNGGAGGVDDTGFEAAYNPDPTGYTLANGQLCMTTLPGDIFGRFDEDPGTPTGTDDARNVFYSSLDGLDSTVVEAKVNVSGLNANFHGGGIWLGTDEDHYIRLGAIHNGGNIVVEAIRENEDLWTVRGGPGGDIVGRGGPVGPAPGPLDVYLQLVRTGNTAQAFYSLDNATWLQVGGPGFTYDNIVTGPGQGFGGGPTIEGGFKVGAYAFGGPPTAPPATVCFDNFAARSTVGVIPEPGSLMLLLGGAPLALAALRRRAR